MPAAPERAGGSQTGQKHTDPRRWLAIGATAVIIAGVAWLVARPSDDGDPLAATTTSTTLLDVSDLRSFDFQNFAYRLSCDSLGSYDVTVVDGLWEGFSDVEPDVELSTSEGIEVVHVDDPAGSSTAAVVRLPCSFGANTVISNVLVFRAGVDGEPEQIGDTVFGALPSAGDEPGTFVVWNEAPGPDDAGCCPSAFERSTYRIGGEHLERVETVTLPTEETPFAQSGTTSTTESRAGDEGGDARSLDQIEDDLRNPAVGRRTTYLRGAFTLRPGAVVRDAIGPSAAVVAQDTGFLMSPELVRFDGVDYAVSTETSDVSGDTTRQLRVVLVSDLVGAATDDIVLSRIARFDAAGDAYVDDVPPAGYESMPDGSVIRQYVDESDDTVTTLGRIPEDRG